MKPRRLGYVLFAVLAAFVIAPAWADSTGNAGSSDQDMLAQFKKISRISDGLVVYNQQLQRQLLDQKKVMEQLNESINSAEATRRQLVPLLQNMIASLETFINLDLPFDLTKRRARIEDLKAAMNRPDLSIAEKFKKVLDAYQAELDYDTNYETYSEFITINGRHREVDVLRWGRLVLAFQTPDQQTAGVWDNKTRQWKILSSKFHAGIRRAFRMARGITSKSLVTLPVPAAEPASAQN